MGNVPHDQRTKYLLLLLIALAIFSIISLLIFLSSLVSLKLFSNSSLFLKTNNNNQYDSYIHHAHQQLPYVHGLQLPPLSPPQNNTTPKTSHTKKPPKKPSPQSTPIVAICMTGHPRTLYYHEVPRLHKLTIQDLEAPSAIFMVLDDTEQTTGRMKHAQDNGVRRDRYSKAIDMLEPRGIVWLDRKMKNGWAKWVKGRMRENIFWEMFFKKEMCWRLVKEYERKTGVRFSHVVSTRPDAMFPRGLGRADVFSEDKIWIGRYNEYMDKDEFFDAPFHQVLRTSEEIEKRTFVTDVVAVVPRKHAEKFFGQVLKMKGDIGQGKKRFSGDTVQKKLFDDADLTRFVEEHPLVFKIRRNHKGCKRKAPGNRHVSWC